MEVKMRAGRRMIPVQLEDKNGIVELKWAFNRDLLEEIKAFDGARWNPETKTWTVKKNQRNAFQMEYLLGGDPYATYDAPLVEYSSDRPLRDHQLTMVRNAITFRQMILAAEMGTGKSLAAIEVIEWAERLFAETTITQPKGYLPAFDAVFGTQIDVAPREQGRFQAYWVAPKSALRSVELELRKWGCDSYITLHTYESLKTKIANWKDDDLAPFVVVFDESSRAKTPTAQRSQAALQLGDGVRSDWGNQGFVLLMSGTPAPKSPADWWMQCEIARPGFIKEGTYDKFKKRLGLIVQKESIQGGVYPHLVTWLDDENKCAVCGMPKNSINHDEEAAMFGGEKFHDFVASVNEVSRLYKRMKGLVHVVFKKDCLDLPDKYYEIIRCKPSQSTLRAASIIASRSTTAIGAMILLRELSDGFQYDEIEDTHPETCPLCHGAKEIEAAVDNYELDPETGEQIHNVDEQPLFEMRTCFRCSGVGQVVTFKRIATQLPCPKDDVVKELLDRYEDIGRTVFFAGFTGSIDRLVQLCLSQQWQVIRVDGKGWWSSIDGLKKAVDMLELFQDGRNTDHPKIAFIGQPSSAGMGLTLTASSMICYYSNDFNAESRVQSEDRCHRMGMDINRGCTIYDIVHLDTDQKVIDNLKKKRVLQAMSMGEIRTVFGQTTDEDRIT